MIEADFIQKGRTMYLRVNGSLYVQKSKKETKTFWECRKKNLPSQDSGK